MCGWLQGGTKADLHGAAVGEGLGPEIAVAPCELEAGLARQGRELVGEEVAEIERYREKILAAVVREVPGPPAHPGLRLVARRLFDHEPSQARMIEAPDLQPRLR